MSRTFSTAVACVILVLSCAAAHAQSFAMRAYSFTGGGTSTEGAPGSLRLSGSIGPADGTPVPLSGGEFSLVGGFTSVVAALQTAPCLGDVDGDRDVDLGDLTLVLSNFGLCSGDPDFDTAADLNGDGCVDLVDLSSLLSRFGIEC